MQLQCVTSHHPFTFKVPIRTINDNRCSALFPATAGPYLCIIVYRGVGLWPMEHHRVMRTSPTDNWTRDGATCRHTRPSKNEEKILLSITHRKWQFRVQQTAEERCFCRIAVSSSLRCMARRRLLYTTVFYSALA